MPITFTCPCGKVLRVADENAGRRVKCPACQTVASVPAPEPDFEVVEDEPKEKLSPVTKPTVKPAAKRAEEDDDEDDRRGYGVAKSKKHDDEDDEPKPKKKPKPKKRQDDDDDEYEQDPPRSRRPSNPDAGKKALYIIGGGLMVVGGIALAIIGWQSQGRSATRGLIFGICLAVVGLGTIGRGITGNFED